MLLKNNIKSVPISVKKPKANAIVERLHQTISTMIAITIQENPPRAFDTAFELIHRENVWQHSLHSEPRCIPP